MSSHTYAPAEFNLGLIDLTQRAQAASYTNPLVEVVVNTGDGKTIQITVDEVVDAATLKADILAATPPSLTLDPFPRAEIIGDGVDTLVVTLADSRGAAASGKKVKLVLGPGAQPLPVDGEIKTLDASGQVSFQIGPTSTPSTVSGVIGVRFEHLDGSTPPVGLPVQFVLSRRAKLKIDGNSALGDLTYTAWSPGAAGNSTTVAHEIGATGAGQEYRPLAYSAAGSDITLTFGTDALGASVVPTAVQAYLAFQGSSEAKALVSFALRGDGSGSVGTQVATALAGGTDG